MGLIRNLATFGAAVGSWALVMPYVVRARMDGYVERNLAAYDAEVRRKAMEEAVGGPVVASAGHH